MNGKKAMGLGMAIGMVATLLAALAVWLLTVYTGAYNVAATDPHADVVRWTFDTTMPRSVADRAADLTPPENIRKQSLREGAKIYAVTCAHCHGAPGTEHERWARNMRPQPPELVNTAAHWETREVFWIVKNGIKMSGMPAYAPEHDDQTIWAIATFVKSLPGMTPEDYEAATRSAGDH